MLSDLCFCSRLLLLLHQAFFYHLCSTPCSCITRRVASHQAPTYSSLPTPIPTPPNSRLLPLTAGPAAASLRYRLTIFERIRFLSLQVQLQIKPRSILANRNQTAQSHAPAKITTGSFHVDSTNPNAPLPTWNRHLLTSDPCESTTHDQDGRENRKSSETFLRAGLHFFFFETGSHRLSRKHNTSLSTGTHAGTSSRADEN